ncbi:DUF3800 domain-containing protein [Methylacidimicrobium sp. B4]|uniref:DUF3800 domain-containing protein n=1 Tax=Methylacidimicrobium sp. B4 TaxID=2796139 RepID=UPI001A9046CD|nr:DUF3800 domain-containing protein [Methylacidimicrobium sp. B4]QSR84166.1 DUF3800 domain-containing protein [Methylacidimicrobium sp. B4]
MSSRITHIGFADESNWKTGRFRSLGLISTSACFVDALDTELRELLEKSQLTEFKWNKLAGAKERFAANRLCAFAVKEASAHHLRIDVLVWDTEDSRHTILRRDDIANLERMYYHLFCNVLRKRWPNDAVWRLHPDEHTELDWGTLQDCLAAQSTRVKIDDSLFAGGPFPIRLRRDFGIEVIQSVHSEANPVLQLADLFAGLAVFSRNKYEKYEQWRANQSPQARLFDSAEEQVSMSQSERARFQVLKEFDELCKGSKLGVSLKSTQGLRTRDPKNPINFWMYEPQHPEDKAPQKGKRAPR